MNIIKERQIRLLIRKKGFRIGKNTLKKLALEIEGHAKSLLERIIRNVVVSGRKTVRKNDFDF